VEPGSAAGALAGKAGLGLPATAPGRPWRRPSRAQVAAFARLGRPQFLLNSMLLVTLGMSVAAYQGRRLEWGGWVLAQLFAWCTHLMTHYCNEYFDLEADRLNADPTRLTGGSRILVGGVLSPLVALSASLVLLFADLALTVAMPGASARFLALLGVALAWFYTAPPARLNYRALGEADCALGLNVILPVLAYRLQAPGIPAALLALAAALFVMQTARMTVMNLADHDSDLLAGKRTLANVLGPGPAVRLYAGLQAAGYAALAGLTAAGVVSLLPRAAGAGHLGAIGAYGKAAAPYPSWRCRGHGEGGVVGVRADQRCGVCGGDGHGDRRCRPRRLPGGERGFDRDPPPQHHPVVAA